MKWRPILILFYAAMAVSTVAGASQAPDRDRMKALAINRALLASFETEYLDHLKEKTLATPRVKREIANLKYKIEALNEESSRLAAPLSEKERASEFLKDVVVKKEVAARPVLGETNASPARIQTLEKVPAMHEKALKLVGEKKLKEAAKVYEDITMNDPDDDQAYLIMGHCYLLTGQYAKAETAFQNAVHIDPANVDEITPFYENMILNDPDDDTAYTNLGYAQMILGNSEKAKSAFEDALTINPDNPLAMSGYRILESQSQAVLAAAQ